MRSEKLIDGFSLIGLRWQLICAGRAVKTGRLVRRFTVSLIVINQNVEAQWEFRFGNHNL